MLGDEPVSEATSAQEGGRVIPMVEPDWERGQSAASPAEALFEPEQPGRSPARTVTSRARIRRA